MPRVRQVERSRYHIYWGRATEFRDIMRIAGERAWWSAAALNAIHCLISAADAVLVFRQTIRSTGEGHLEVIDLLGRDRDLSGITRATGHLRKGLAKKNLVAYEDRELSVSEAKEIVDHAERFYTWASNALPRPTG